MIIKGIVFTVLLATLAVQDVLSANRRLRDIRDLVEKTMEAAKKQLHSKTEEIKDLEEKTDSKRQDLDSRLRVLEKDLHTESGKEMLQIRDDLRELVEALTKMTEAHGVDIKDCVATEEETTRGVIVHIVEGIGACLTQQQQEAQQLMSRARAEVQMAEKEASKQERALDSCLTRSPSDALRCIKSVAKKANEKMDSNAQRLRDVLEDITDAYHDAEEKVLSCGQDVVGAAIEQEERVQQELSTCVYNKL